MRVVGYVRLSRDEDRENYSSIIEQQNIIRDYAKGKGWVIEKMYIDDNYSGYTFDRPEFINMMNELENGSIDLVIAKDLSRIGRNNGKVLVLIDKFKELNKGLILAKEGNGGNGLDVLNDDNDMLGITTWFNEMYVKDISRKVRASMHSKQKNGELLMGNHYGYKKIKLNNSFQLVVDEDIRPVIELIFKLYIEGSGYKKICDVLEENGFITPSEYLRRKHDSNGRVFKNQVSLVWQTHMIQRIICNDVYIGTLTTKKKQARLIKGKQETVPKEQQFTFHNHHEAIINKDIFELAQSVRIRKVETNYRNKSKYDYMFSRFTECADCGYVGIGLNLAKYPKEKRGYNCTMYQKYGKAKCTNHSITEEKLLIYVKDTVKEILNIYENYINKIQIENKKKNIQSALNKTKKDLDIANQELKMLISQKIKDIMKEQNVEYKTIIEDSYNELENDKKKSITELVKKIDQLEIIEKSKDEVEIKKHVEVLKEIINSDRPNKALLELVIDKIYLNSDKIPKIKLKRDIQNVIDSIDI
jgi:site-specific DNA recombinase